MATVAASCTVLSDTTLPGAEGMMERRITIGSGTASVTLHVVNDSVFRAVVTDPSIRTEDSLGVGTELDDLLALSGAKAIEGEGRFFVTVPRHCGLSFRIAALREGRRGTTDELVRATFPRNTPVDQVLAFGCAP